MEERHGGAYAIGGGVAREGRPTVEGMEASDHLPAVDGRPLRDLSSDAVLRVLGGQPGAPHVLTSSA